MASNQGKIDLASWDGSLSRDEFQTAARAFAEQWNKFNTALPRCSWVPSPKLPWLHPTSQVEGYLSVDNVILPCTAEECSHSNVEDGEEELSYSNHDSFIDNAMLDQNHVQERYHYDFHVVYSISYRVPVLYFRVNCSDGQPLTVDEIEKNIPGNSAKVLRESKWTFITQEDHPYLNRPWYTLHPCGTSEWMKLLFMNERFEAPGGVGIAKYLVSWFSVVGQVFGLKVPFEMLC